MKRKLQVFVSSTFNDLRDERQAAVEAILKAGHIPAGMELFSAGDKSQLQTIERWIDESDVYMLILGGRYGSVEPISGVSYTELEYDYAKQNGKRLFSVVITEEAIDAKIKNSGKSVIEVDRKKELDLFRTKVLSNMSAFFGDIKDIKLSVHESLSDFSHDASLLGWVSASEIDDTRVLHDEIGRLKLENDSLKKMVDEREKDGVAMSSHEYKYDDLIEILKGIDIEIPKILRTEESIESLSLLDVLSQARSALVNGVQNNEGISDYDRFVYFNIAPKLQIHGLVNNESILGVAYRRSYLNDHGKLLVAELDRRAVKAKKKSKETSPSADK